MFGAEASGCSRKLHEMASQSCICSYAIALTQSDCLEKSVAAGLATCAELMVTGVTDGGSRVLVI